MSSHMFAPYRQPLESIKLATDKFDHRNLIPSVTNNVEKPSGIWACVSGHLCLDLCIHRKVPASDEVDNQDRPQDRSMIVYKAKVRSNVASDYFKKDSLTKFTRLNHKHVAVRKYVKGKKGRIHLKKEFQVLCRLKQQNIMSVGGVCDEDNENIIVYRHEATRFLRTCLGDPNLTWKHRLHICVSIASALKYIHEEKDILHGNINSSVILLDDKWNAKLFGFEFSLIRNKKGKEENPTDPEYKGTIGYVDPALHHRKDMTKSSEMYSFGVLLLEIMWGKKVCNSSYVQSFTDRFTDWELDANIDPALRFTAAKLDAIIDPALRKQMGQRSCVTFLNTACKCLQIATLRLNISQIVKELNSALDLQLLEEFVRLRQPLKYIELATTNFDASNYFDNHGRSEMDHWIVYKAKTKTHSRWDIFIQDFSIIGTKLNEKHIVLRKYVKEEQDRVSLQEDFQILHDSLKNKIMLSDDKMVLVKEKGVNEEQDLSLIGTKLNEKNVAARKYVKEEPDRVRLRKEFDRVLSRSLKHENKMSDKVVRDKQEGVKEERTRVLIQKEFEILRSLDHKNIMSDKVVRDKEEGVKEERTRVIIQKEFEILQSLDHENIMFDKVVRDKEEGVKEEGIKEEGIKEERTRVLIQKELEILQSLDHENIMSDEVVRVVEEGVKEERGRVLLQKEFEILRSLNHENIISVCGVCDEGDENIIVYRHEATRFLHTCLGDPTLTWKHRLHICVCIASALKYIHEEKDILHGNISSSVILLDDNWKAKLFGFEFSLIRNEKGEEDNPIDPKYKGTTGYVDPALSQRKYMTKSSEVYSFGVLLFEIMCGEKICDNSFAQSRAREFKDWELYKFVLPALKERMDQNSYLQFAKTAYDCLQKEPTDRPCMDQIFGNLNMALDHQRNFETRTDLKVDLEEIKESTNNFDSANSIGSGGFGHVYKAKLEKYRDKYVAIKRIENKNKKGTDGFNIETGILGRNTHPNILPLLGFCKEGTEMILITEYAINGSLTNFLERKDNFTWERRLEVCLGIARGIDHLHSPKIDEPTVIHRDIKSDNILMGLNWAVKIADFGLSRERPSNQHGSLNTREGGTPHYKAPESILQKKVDEKSDIYSFGIVLFEILCGAMAYDPKFAIAQKKGYDAVVQHIHKRFFSKASHDKKFTVNKYNGLPTTALRYLKQKKQTELVDSSIRETFQNAFTSIKGPDKDSLNTFWDLAYKCIQKEPKERCPTMKDAIKELDKALFQATLKIKYENVELGSDFGGAEDLKRGRLSHLGDIIDVLVKKVESKQPARLKEVKILFNYKHKNIISLIGYGIDELENMFVYEDIKFKGSLDKYLNDASLTWIKRLEICIDVAEGLEYLHTHIKDQVVVHGDIKSSSIVVNDKWEARIANFGSSSIRKRNESSSRLKRIDNDIFFFGRLMLEILRGSEISDDEVLSVEQESNWEVFGELDNPDRASSAKYIEIGTLCLTKPYEQSMEEVLKYLRDSQKTGNGSQARDPSSSTVVVPNPNATTITPRSNPMVLDSLKDMVTLKIPESNIYRRGESLSDREMASFSRGVTVAATSHELNILFHYKHENIIGLKGYLDDGDSQIFVYYEDITSKGCLEDHMNKPELTWTKRLKICIDVAKGLNFLHTRGGGERQDEVVLHGNLTSSAILLDDNWKARISNFKDSKIIEKDKTTYTSDVVASDIESFGDLLLEILSSWSEIQGNGTTVEESLTTFRNIADRCKGKGEKPTALAVLSKLKKALRAQVLLTDRGSEMLGDMHREDTVNPYIPPAYVPYEAEHSNRGQDTSEIFSELEIENAEEIEEAIHSEMLGDMHREDTVHPHIPLTYVPHEAEHWNRGQDMSEIFSEIEVVEETDQKGLELDWWYFVKRRMK